MIIFKQLNWPSELLAKLLVLTGVEVRYLELSYKKNLDKHNHRLYRAGITPLPIETLDNIAHGELCDDALYSKKQSSLVDEISTNLMESQVALYGGVDRYSEKIQLAYKMSREFGVSCKASIWASQFPNEKFYLISIKMGDLFLPFREKNIKLIYLPNIISLFPLVLRFLSKVRYLIYKKIKFHTKKDNTNISNKPVKDINDSYKVAFVVHMGLTYGSLFEKDLFYSPKEGSDFNVKNMLHISYTGVYPSKEFIRWLYVAGCNISFVKCFSAFFSSFRRSVLLIRNMNDVLSCFYLSGFYIRYLSYQHSLSKYTSLKMALIDYEILCPKPMLLALESLGIESVAVQERFILSFYRSYYSILEHYLCASEYCVDVIENSDSYIVKNYVSVGQYRSDELLLSDGDFEIPNELSLARQQNKKIIIALGFHTQEFSFQSKTDPLFSWSAHISFIEDMIAISRDIDNVFIVLRYKSTEWMDFPVFRDVLERLNNNENIVISTEYSINYYSYSLCSHAELVIAKHTSLGDECLSRGIPVLFHDYTHNRNSIISTVYDYEGSKIICHDYKQLLTMSKKMLAGDSKKYLDEIKHLYGSYGDGNVRNRIHQWLENELEELNERSNIQ